MDFQITGEITAINEQEAVSDKLTKQEFIIKTDEAQYPQLIRLELVNKNVSQLVNWNVGDTVKVNFNIRGNEWKGKVYNSLAAWKITAP